MTSTHGNLAYNKPDYSDSQEFVIVDKPIEWIRTAEAAKILGVKSTEGVLVIVRGKNRDNPNWIVRYLNVGTDDMPRYMLNKEDIIELADRRKSQTDL
jgi:hypothetical protein